MQKIEVGGADLVSEGVRNVREMERHIRIYVKDELFPASELPSFENRQFYPRRQDIRSHMYIKATKNRLAKMDQENLQLKIDKWKQESPNDFLYSRSHGAVITNDGENGEDKGRDEDECVIKVSTLTVFSRKRKQLPTQNMRLLKHDPEMSQITVWREGN